MQAHISKYTYRYLEPTKSVYTIVRYPDHQNKSIQKSSFYSVPFQQSRDSHQRDYCNVIMTCLYKEQAAYYKQELMKDSSYDIKYCYNVEEYALRDITYYSEKMKIPLVVIMASYCELTGDFKDGGTIHDIFYTNKMHDSSAFEGTM